MAALDDAESIQPTSRAEWRQWLADHHDSSPGVWVITYKKNAAKAGPTYEDLVLEALCFGWIDSTARRVDEERTKLYLCPRRRGGGWAATNKARIERLEADGLIMPAGRAVIEQAMADGSWTKLDGSESLTVPRELRAALRRYPGSTKEFNGFPAGVRKQLIFWVDDAKREETKAKRADEIARLAQQGIRANQWVPKDRR